MSIDNLESLPFYEYQLFIDKLNEKIERENKKVEQGDLKDHTFDNFDMKKFQADLAKYLEEIKELEKIEEAEAQTTETIVVEMHGIQNCSFSPNLAPI